MYGIQLYSVKSHMMANVKDALRDIAGLGYTLVEPAGFFGTSAEDFKAYCEEYGLAVSGSHNHLKDMAPETINDTIAYFKTIGCKRFIIASAPISTAAELDDTIEKINAAQPIFEAAGIELLYHNHHRELMPNKDGQIAHLELQRRTNINFEIDIYWCYRASVSPIYLLEQLGERVKVLHLKDGTMEAGAPLGKGTAPVADVVAWAKTKGMPMVVENEPVAEREMSEAGICIEYLKSLEN